MLELKGSVSVLIVRTKQAVLDSERFNSWKLKEHKYQEKEFLWP